MTIMVRGNTGELRRLKSFLVSLSIHGAVFALLVIGTGAQSVSPRPIYDQEIRPYEHKLIWYSLQSRVPAVRPTDAKKMPRPPRAARKFDQSLIAGVKDDAKPAQKVWVPDPPKVDLITPKAEPLPNILAVAPAPKRPLRKFQPPPAPARKVTPTPQIADAPDAALKLTAAIPTDFSLDTKFKRPLRAFVPPPPTNAEVKKTAAELPAPPEAQMVTAPVNTASMAIVGLDPAKTMDIPKPPAPRDANFSAGPKPNPDGESSPASSAMLTVPGLYVNGGPKDARPTLTGFPPLSQQNLMAAMRPHNAAPNGGGQPHAPRVSSSPDPSMNGRVVYMMAIQMQNITSYSGSWMVWFAEHQPLPGAPPLVMRPPDPVHKVDPKYIADAVLERVEGIVRLSAVIRKDGRVESVAVLKHLDDRLDKSAEEALAKWQFEPALRDGTPVDIDAVFEIPFRLAPRTAK